MNNNNKIIFFPYFNMGMSKMASEVQKVGPYTGNMVVPIVGSYENMNLYIGNKFDS